VYGVWAVGVQNFTIECPHVQRRIQDFKLGGVDFKKLRRAEGGTEIFGVFRVKNYDFMPKNHIFSNCGGRREMFWVFRWKFTILRQKIIFFPILGGACRVCPPGSTPAINNCFGQWISTFVFHSVILRSLICSVNGI
jgi:hypothetical protein